MGGTSRGRIDGWNGAFYAHSKTDPETGEYRPLDEWEPLFTPFGDNPGNHCLSDRARMCEECRDLDPAHGHLNKVAWWTAKFASEMFFCPGSDEAKAAREWGYLAGLWHDLGKFAPKWQKYLKSKADPHEAEVNDRIDHATAGAQHAVKAKTPLAHLLGFAISGHHSGLLDAISEYASLEKRLGKPIEDSAIPQDILERLIPDLPSLILERIEHRDGDALAIFNRMLFSCLVDADFLATEAVMAPERTRIRPQRADGVLEKMVGLVEAHVAAFGPPDSQVNRARAHVFRSCLDASEGDQGLFTLTVPTGGGKTLSSLAFALRHALKHGMRRVIYVIPFTSIIEQNAGIFRDVLKPINSETNPVVIEHHSNLSPEEETTRSRLAAENWDAPLVVTTAVQFYESLHAARTSQCRKLHNIANAVVILDEAQCLPVDYLRPCLVTLRELARAYHTSIVLCTATQPAIHHSPTFSIGLKSVREIVPDLTKLYDDSLKRRVRVKDRGSLTDAEITAEMADKDQVLVIVNTRNHARKLFQQLPKCEDRENWHLSALMCPAHRQKVLEEVRERLKSGKSVRLVSTQLVEAGVDIDFHVVYRSLAGIDSIAQAAGRCNRNGKRDFGITHVFRSEHSRAEAYFRETAQIADRVLGVHGDDPLGLESVEMFFSLYYHQHNPPNGKRWDTKAIEGEFKFNRTNRDLPFLFYFATVAKNFRLIENAQFPVLIPFDGRARELLDELKNESIPLNRQLLRQLQRYTVQVHEREFQGNVAQFKSVRDGQFRILICPETHYSNDFGLSFDNESAFLNA